MVEVIDFSIIIPVKEINDYIRKFVPIILEQTNKNFEIIILPNESSDISFPKTKIISTGKIGPAEKRDLGAKNSRGKILAFIDDDAYPEKNWLERAAAYFKDKTIAGVGGPNLTPPESNFFQHLSGKVLSSFIVSGTEAHRYKTGKVKVCYDLPSCNLFIRKSDFIQVGGFSTEFWPGEDTKLCLDLKKMGKKLFYDPALIVFHHRRENLKGYIKQIFSYAKHRGYFVRKFPETSRKFAYFVPSLFVLGIVFGFILSFYSIFLRNAYLIILSIYFLIIFYESVRIKQTKFIISFILLAFLTHIIYGGGFIMGLLKINLKSKYRK